MRMNHGPYSVLMVGMVHAMIIRHTAMFQSSTGNTMVLKPQQNHLKRCCWWFWSYNDTTDAYSLLQAIYIYILIHLKVTYEELTTSSAPSSFSTTYQSSVCFTCSPQVCFGCVTMWLAHSPRPNHLWSATWSPQVGTCLCRYHPSLNLYKGGKFLLVAPKEYPQKRLCTRLPCRLP